MCTHCAVSSRRTAECIGGMVMTDRPVGVAIVGCGLIGRKRAAVLAGAKLIVCSDLSMDRAWALVGSVPGAVAEAGWRTAGRRNDVDIVIVATTNDALAEVSVASLAAGEHVLGGKTAAPAGEGVGGGGKGGADKGG